MNIFQMVDGVTGFEYLRFQPFQVNFDVVGNAAMGQASDSDL